MIFGGVRILFDMHVTFVIGLSPVHEEYPVQRDSAGCIDINLLYSTLKTLDTVSPFYGGSATFGVADVSEHLRVLPYLRRW
jgi:hypothetical protein